MLRIRTGVLLLSTGFAVGKLTTCTESTWVGIFVLAGIPSSLVVTVSTSVVAVAVAAGSTTTAGMVSTFKIAAPTATTTTMCPAPKFAARRIHQRTFLTKPTNAKIRSKTTSKTKGGLGRVLGSLRHETGPHAETPIVS